jgi:hypothetical protein
VHLIEREAKIEDPTQIDKVSFIAPRTRINQKPQKLTIKRWSFLDKIAIFSNYYI